MATEAERNRGAGAFSTPGVDIKPETGPSQIITQNPVVQFNLKGVNPPSELYLNQADRLMLTAINSDPNILPQAILEYRILRAADGQLALGNIFMPATSDRVPQRQMIDIAEGYLLGCKVTGTGGTTKGRCYFALDVARGSVAGRVLYQQLIADYGSRGHDPTWPGGSYVHSVDGAGWVRIVAGTTPAAGGEINEVVPTTARWRIKSIRFRLTASATVANRTVRLLIDDPVNQSCDLSANVVQTAGQVVDYTFGIGLSFVNDVATFVVSTGLPENLLFAASRWRTVTQGIQAGDQYSNVGYNVEEWLEL